MYGDGNSTKLVRDIIASANQVADGMRESTGIDLQALIAGFAGGKAAQEAEIDSQSSQRHPGIERLLNPPDVLFIP